MDLLRLSKDLLFHILLIATKEDFKSLASFQCLNHSAYELISEEYLWRLIASKYFIKDSRSIDKVQASWKVNTL